MWDRIESLEHELRDVEIRLGDPAVQSDSAKLADLGRRYKQLEEVVGVGRRLRRATDDLGAAQGRLMIKVEQMRRRCRRA